MSDSNNPNSIRNKTEAQENDNYFKVFRHLEGVNQRNRAIFDELLRYTYTNISEQKDSDPQNNNI